MQAFRGPWFVGAAVVAVLVGLGCKGGPEPDFQPEPGDLGGPSSRAEPKGTEPGAKRDEAAKPAAPSAPALTPRPTSPDPEDGKFTLAEATAGLGGPKKGDLVAEIETSEGTFECALYADKAPVTVANFVGLARGKRPWWDARKGAWVTERYYDGTTFHRVIPGFMIQGGDYLGTGAGDIGYTIDDELDPSLKHDEAGQLCMANKGPDTNAAQFFITDAAAPHLDQMHSYTIFGQCKPTSLVSKIAHLPKSSVTITHITIHRS